MKFTRLAAFLSIACFSLCQAEIIEVKSFAEANEHFQNLNKKNSLAIFDIDQTLLMSEEPAFQMPNMTKFPGAKNQALKSLNPSEKLLALNFMCLNFGAKIIDNTALEIIDSLQKRQVPTIALTNMLTFSLGAIKDPIAARIEQLKKVNIDFSKNFAKISGKTFTNLKGFFDSHPQFNNGVLFCNGEENSKDEVLSAFLSSIKFSPKRVVVIDDRIDCIQKLHKMLQDNKIECTCIHYTGNKLVKVNPVSKERFNKKWQYLANAARTIAKEKRSAKKAKAA